MLTLLCLFIPLSPSCTIFTILFSIPASPFLPCKQVHQSHFSRFHIYALIYDICFSLPDLLTSLCVTGSSLIHLPRTDSNSFFLWLSNIPFCFYACVYMYIFIQLFSSFICWWTFWLLACLSYCVWLWTLLHMNLFEWEILCFLGICLVVGLLSCMIVLFLVF